jgi:hypothetical protein
MIIFLGEFSLTRLQNTDDLDLKRHCRESLKTLNNTW